MAQKPSTVAIGSDSAALDEDDMQLFTVAEVAKRLSVKPWSVYNLCRTGVLPSVYMGPKSRRIKADDLRSYIESLPTDRPAAAS